ncbi:MAG: hypothetical protein HYZ49_16350 [Chloroflexi bacterium]|nr:hypothetical protein [Chloroflexota bacterium]
MKRQTKAWRLALIIACLLFGLGWFASSRQPESSPTITFIPSTPSTSVNKVPVPEQGAYLGVTIDFNGERSAPDQLAEYQSLTGHLPAIGMWYVAAWEPEMEGMRQLVETGVIPFITFEPRRGSLDDLLAGQRDDRLRAWARAIRELGSPVFFRFAHEMNGDWSPWSGAKNGGGGLGGFGDPALPDGPERYIAAYRHVYNLFADEGALNVSWVWSPNVLHGVPTDSWNWPDNYYPGDDYVDWVGMDGYNWGTAHPATSWQSFDEVFADSYTGWAAAHDKPVMIAEFASTEMGGHKAQWIADAQNSLASKYPLVRAVTWFNLDKETDWRINSSPETQAAYAAFAGDPFFVQAGR